MPLIIGGILLFLVIVFFMTSMLISERKQPPPPVYIDQQGQEANPQMPPAGHVAPAADHRKYGSVPFTILEHIWSGYTLTIVTQNIEPNSLTMTGFAAGGGSIPYGTDYTRIAFAGGEKKTVSAKMSTSCSPGTSYELNITFDYDRDGVRWQEVGAKPIIGKCG
jgi:hypothetical protein